MQTQNKTAGETAKTITLVAIIDCHARNNVVLENLTESESRGIRRMAAKKGFLVAERKPKEPTCDNCDHMTIRQTGSGNHRHCDLMGLYIPDNEQSPSCSFHSSVNKFLDRFSGKGTVQNTLRKGGKS